MSGGLIKLRVYPSTAMSSDHCIDAMVDWKNLDGHYDARVARSCRPGDYWGTDMNGDFYWNEPSNWAGQNVVDMQKGYGYTFDDDWSDGFRFIGSERFVGTTGQQIYDSPPRTTVDCFARTTTLYNDGHVDWTPNYGYPVHESGTC